MADILHRYLFEDLSVRGELVQLDDVYQAILANQAYPAPLQKLLGEMLVATSLLTATLKFEGAITMQLQGDGPVSLLVINGSHKQKMRGIARWQGEVTDHASLHDLLGKGHLVITIEPKQGERYQGIVGLDGDNLSQILENYFANSEQLKTRLWLSTGVHQGKVSAAGMLIQVMPDATDSADDFEHLEKLTDTVKDNELFSLTANDLLYRLYNQEKVRVFEPQPVSFFCGCSRQRSGSAIVSLGRGEADEILAEHGSITLGCDYCGAKYHFNKSDVAELFLGLDKGENRLH